ncbi:uncharacterized protein [Littorina saxatilis]|uniref:Uncharacterized protein n=1 Tax=Littorina saxatilis TaxID=31220 RepID=A0AAN9APV1_9CAEN
MPPGCFGSKEQSGPMNTTRTNVSVNEDSPDSIVLTYQVNGASSSSCSFSWEPTEGGYIGTMNARDGGTQYQHTFPNAVPRETVEQLGQPGKTKNGNYVIFTFQRRQRNISLQNYVRR